jgi:hypothetical protein
MAESAITPVTTTQRDVLANLLHQLYDKTFGKGATVLDPVSFQFHHAPLDAAFIWRELRLLCNNSCANLSTLKEMERPIGPGDFLEMQSKVWMEINARFAIEEVTRILTKACLQRDRQLTERRAVATSFAITAPPGAPALRAVLGRG